MMDLSDTIKPKSDQLNADDLLVDDRTIKITAVKKMAGDQPVFISFEGDDGKPWKPCLTVRRILIALWGKDGDSWVGKSLTIFRDPTVKYAGLEYGGIRVSHMSGLTKKATIVLTTSQGKKKPFTVEPLGNVKPAATAVDKKEAAKKKAAEIIKEINAGGDEDAVQAVIKKHKAILDRLRDAYSGLYDSVTDASGAKLDGFSKEDEECPI